MAFDPPERPNPQPIEIPTEELMAQYAHERPTMRKLVMQFGTRSDKPFPENWRDTPTVYAEDGYEMGRDSLYVVTDYYLPECVSGDFNAFGWVRQDLDRSD